MRFLLTSVFVLFLGSCVRAQCPTNLLINDNQDVATFRSNFPNCTQLPGSLAIRSTEISNPASLSGLSVLTAIGEDLIIFDLAISEITGLQNLQTVGGDFILANCPDLTGNGFTGALSITEIGGFLSLQNLPSMSQFIPLNDLNILSSGFGTDVYKFSSLAPLSGVQGTMAEVNISNNGSLTNIDALAGVSNIGALTLVDNSQLSNCAIAPICAALANGAPVTISGNATGCESTAAVTLQCSPPCTQPDYDALEEFYNATNGNNWTNNTGWLTDCDVCDWFGITCNTDGRVTRISLLSNNLTGNIASVNWTELEQLERLGLSLNPITGAFPQSLWFLDNLEQINMQGCELSGNFQSPGSNASLRILDIGGNNFINAAPTFGTCPALTTVIIANNNFVASNFSAFNPADQPNLTTVLAQNNQFFESLPEGLGDYPDGQISLLRLDGNNFVGCYPTGYASLCGANVNFSGNPNLPDGGSAAFFNTDFCTASVNCDPDCHPDYPALAALYNATDGDNWTDNTNWLTDCDVCDWVGITCDANDRVRRLELPDNNLVGTLPPEIADLDVVEFLRFNNNDFQGSSIPDLTGLASLIRLRLHRANFGGPLPTLGSKPDLTDFSLFDNALTGMIPSAYNPTNFPALIRFYVDRNQLSGELPANIPDFPVLEEFNVHTNNFSGCYPTSYDQLCDLPSRQFFANPGLPGGGGTAYFEAAVCDIGQFCEIQCPDSYVANSNAAAARFGLLYPDCTELVGRLEYGAANFSNGDGLQNLTRVGELSVRMLNGNETSGIANILTVDGLADFFNNPQWTDDGSGPPLALQTVGGALNLRGLSGLTDARLFSNVATVDSLIIQICGFTTLEDLSGITSVGKYLEVDLNGDLTSLNGLENLGGNLDRVQIRFNGLLTNLDGLGDGLTTTRLEISNHDLLTDISGAAGVTVTEQLRITSNDGLAVCAEDYVCAYLNDPDVSVSINGNAQGCANVAEVSAQCGPCHPDLDALLAFYTATNGPDWTDNSGWADGAAGTDCDVCNWPGITCFNNRVTDLSLNNNNLSGSLPAAIGDLDQLVLLSLSSNNLSGPIPATIGNLNELERLLLHVNAFTGGLPPELGNLTNLRNLLIYGVPTLGGPIPPELGNAVNLELIQMNGLGLTGPVPASFDQLTKLVILRLSNNSLSGSLPTFLNHPQLERLNLSDNAFSGPVPEPYLNSAVIGNIALSGNDLSGPLPASFGDFPLLTQLFLQNNYFSGCYPGSYTAFCGDLANFSVNPSLPDGGSSDFFDNSFCPDGVDCGTLPVSWLSFIAVVNGKTVALNWTTAEEEQNAGFTVERSAEGRNWLAIGEVPATTASPAGQHHYTYDDQDPLFGESFYRLRQQDLDGATDYSEVRRISLAGSRVQVYPNPAGTDFNIDSDLPQTITLHSADGRTARTIVHTGARTQVQREGLKSGVYWLRFSASGEVVRLILT